MAFTRNTSDRKSRRSSGGEFFWNLLTILVLIAMCVLSGAFIAIYLNPNLPINPLPPPTMPVPLSLPTNTLPPPALPPTWTATVTMTPLPSNTPVPKTPTPTETQIPTGIGIPPTVTLVSSYPFALQGQPTGIDASVLYPERDCKWMGVGGQVVDLQGRPVTGITVQLGGTLNGKAMDQTTLTGLATKYGEAGYEFELAKEPIATSQTLWVRLVDQARLPLSGKVLFDTYAECEKSLIIVNFRQVK